MTEDTAPEEGEARTDEIFSMVGALGLYWTQHPELRLGQIISNLTNGVGDAYYVEDKVLMRKLRESW